MEQEKIRSLSIMLWEREKEIQDLKRLIEEKNFVIKELQAEIKFSDMELNDITQIVNNAREVEYVQKLCDKIRDLSRTNHELTEVYNVAVDLFDYEYRM